MPESKAEFHIGDKVCVLYAGKPLSFVITQMSRAANGKVFYAGEGHGWVSADRLDYDLTAEQKDLIRKFERALYLVHEGADEILRYKAEVFKTLPKSVIEKFQAELAEEREKL